MKRGPYSSKKSKVWQLEMLLRGKNWWKIKDLEKELSCSRRSVFNYINEIRNIIDSDSSPEKGYRIINGSSGTLLTNDEFFNLIELLEEGNDPELKKKVMALVADSRLRTFYLRDVISEIKYGIEKKYMIHIGTYFARNRTSKDLTLIPVHFDEASVRLMAYIKGKKMDDPIPYNLENMRDVSCTRNRYMAEKYTASERLEVDPFGFAINYNTDLLNVALWLKPFAHSQLFRQFPKMMQYIKPLEDCGDYSHELKIEVVDIQPIARFVTGLLNEIKIIGTTDVRNKIEEYIDERVINAYPKNFGKKIVKMS